MPTYLQAVRILSSTSKGNLKFHNILRRQISMTTPALEGHRIEKDTFGKYKKYPQNTFIPAYFFYIRLHAKLLTRYDILNRGVASSK